MKDPPANRLDPRAKTLWRAEAALSAIPLLALAAVAVWLLRRVAIAPDWLAPAPLLAALLWAGWDIGAMPTVRWRLWRYEIGSDEIDLQRGWFTQIRTIVPMARIQHVDTRRGPLERRLGLATVVLYTAAGASQIPALADADAAAARDRIAALANVREDL